MDGSPQRYTYAPAATDACARGSTNVCTDNCSTDCALHHKNLDRIAKEANGLHTDNHLIILWSNSSVNIFCTENESGEHEIVPAYAAVCSVPNSTPKVRIPVIQVLTMDKYDSGDPSDYSVDLEFVKYVLAHETAHTLGLPDMYGVEGHGSETEAVCIMEGPKFGQIKTFCEEIQKGNEEPFCSD